MRNILIVFAASLTLTLIFEGVIALCFRIKRKDVLLFALVNILTNPAVVFIDMVLRSFIPLNIMLWQIPLELGAVAVEGLCYSRFGTDIKHPWLFAIIANVFSYGCGLLINIFL